MLWNLPVEPVIICLPYFQISCQIQNPHQLLPMEYSAYVICSFQRSFQLRAHPQRTTPFHNGTQWLELHISDLAPKQSFQYNIYFIYLKKIYMLSNPLHSNHSAPFLELIYSCLEVWSYQNLKISWIHHTRGISITTFYFFGRK